jgi:hypothetical protein
MQGKSTLRIYGREADYLPVFGFDNYNLHGLQVRRKNAQGIGPFDCTKFMNNSTPPSTSN